MTRWAYAEQHLIDRKALAGRLNSAPNFAFLADEFFVNAFVENATRILKAAESAARSGHQASDVTIMIGAAGEMSMLVGVDWSFESLEAERGARMVYRVVQQQGKVRVEGRAGSQTCVFESGTETERARRLLGGKPEPKRLATPGNSFPALEAPASVLLDLQAIATATELTPVEPPARTWPTLPVESD